MTFNFKYYQKTLRLALVLLLLYVLWSMLAPSGRATYVWSPGEAKLRFGPWRPEDRLTQTAEGYVLKASPVYLPLWSSRPFSRLRLTVRYRLNSADTLAVGVLQDRQLWRYQTAAVDSGLLDSLVSSKQWGVLEQGDLLLLQKQETYASIDDFLAKPPSNGSVAVYNYNWPQPLIISDYRPDNKIRESGGLKGSWTAEVYLKKETAWLELLINRSPADADAKLILRNAAGQVVKEWSAAEFIKSGATMRLLAQVTDLPEGVYRWEWLTKEQTVIDRLTTKQRLWSFVGNVQLTQPAKLWLFGDNLGLATSQPESLGVFKIDQEQIAVDKIYHNFNYLGSCFAKSCVLDLTKGGYKIGLNGRIALWSDGLLRPAASNLSASALSDPKLLYIIAKHQRPLAEADYRIAQVELDLREAARQQGAYELLWSWSGQGAPPEILSLKAEFSGLSLTDLLKKIWSLK